MELSPTQDFIEWFFTLLIPGTQDITLLVDSYIFDPDKAETSNAFRQLFQRPRIVKLRVPGCLFIPFSSIVAYLPHLETLGTAQTKDDYDLSKIDSQTALLPKLHTVEIEYCTTRDVVAGLRTILSLPTVKQILFATFLPTKMNASQAQ